MADHQPTGSVYRQRDRIEPRANARTGAGIVATGTNAEDAKTSGNTQMKPIDWAVSGLRTEMPT